ncbi:LacI family DNA-binding transcriptional regulator [Beijerinckia indica]|uniref:Transcriptional regulator, LacI family n=1 Tax=Beijerinckia indica subsp. indica (strain ATCC 9039 / DSM 1715 / NCIMB 8712) TaxID=395963 RepID=B2IFW5_BEII9|nr:LacI family DNA-binding transcriptional regulator [Beijerinckia indica]ACB95704.1 transcriptional regulator, LacI family [Beijerinckia indica subsp. indica ATCC 9039]
MSEDRWLDNRRIASSVTLTDVAREAGVGESTVSRVLRNHGSFSEKTRERVQSAVDRLGYVPNKIAGALASTGSNLVAIIIPSLANIVFPDVLRGAQNALMTAGFQSVIGITDYDQNQEETLIESMFAWRPAGLLIAGLEHSERAVTMMRASGVRIAELLDTDGTGIDHVVGFSSREAGRVSARYLLARGYRRIGYVGHDLNRDRRAAKRLAGFLEILAEAGIKLYDREIIDAASSIEKGRAGLERLLSRCPKLDAVYFSNDDMAMGGYFLCLGRGIAIPDRLALFGYNGLDVGQCAPQPLTTIRTPRVLIGECGAKLVCSDGPSQLIDVGFELMQGATA